MEERSSCVEDPFNEVMRSLVGLSGVTPLSHGWIHQHTLTDSITTVDAVDAHYVC